MRGFTLAEVMVVTVIVCVISLAVYGTLSNGIKIWQRLGQGIPQEDLNIFFERFSSDLRNSFKYTGISFSGKQDSLDFTGLVFSPDFKRTGVGRIIYSFDQGSGVINKASLDVSEIFRQQPGKTSPVARGIKSLEFGYYYYDTEKKGFGWEEEWAKEELPLAVRIELEFDDGKQTLKFTRTVNIPCA